MRTAKIDICGRKHLLCFSARVVGSVTERCSGAENIDEAMNAKGPIQELDEAVWLLSAMMDGGARYAKVNDIETAPPLTADELLDVLDIGDFAALREKIAETVTRGTARHVEADPGKNAETTPAAP